MPSSSKTTYKNNKQLDLPKPPKYFHRQGHIINKNFLPKLLKSNQPVSLNNLNFYDLRRLVPHLLRTVHTEHPSKLYSPETQPKWWPETVPWGNIRKDNRTEAQKAKETWTNVLRRIVRCCYGYYGCNEMLNLYLDAQFDPQEENNNLVGLVEPNTTPEEFDELINSAIESQDSVNCILNNTSELNLSNKAEHNIIQSNSCPKSQDSVNCMLNNTCEFNLKTKVSSNKTIEETNELQLDNYCLENIKHNLKKEELKISPEKLDLVVQSSNETNEETIELQLTQKQDDTTNYFLLSSDKAIAETNELQLGNYCLSNIKHNLKNEELKIRPDILDLVMQSSNKTNEETNELQLANYRLSNIKHNLEKEELKVSSEKLDLVMPSSNKTIEETNELQLDNYRLSNIKHNLKKEDLKVSSEILDLVMPSSNETIEETNELQLDNYRLSNIKHNLEKEELKISPEKLDLVMPSLNKTIEETSELQLANYRLSNIKHNLENEELKISSEKLNPVMVLSNNTNELQLTQKQDETTNYFVLSPNGTIQETNELQLANYHLENIKHDPKKKQLKISPEKLNLVMSSSNKTVEETNELQLTVTQKQDDTTNYPSNIKHDSTLNYEKYTHFINPVASKICQEKTAVIIISNNDTISLVEDNTPAEVLDETIAGATQSQNVDICKLNLQTKASSNKTIEETNELQLANYRLSNIKHNLEKEELKIRPEKLNLVIPSSNNTNELQLTQKQDDTSNYFLLSPNARIQETNELQLANYRLSNIKHNLGKQELKISPENLNLVMSSSNKTIEETNELQLAANYRLLNIKHVPDKEQLKISPKKLEHNLIQPNNRPENLNELLLTSTNANEIQLISNIDDTNPDKIYELIYIEHTDNENKAQEAKTQVENNHLVSLVEPNTPPELLDVFVLSQETIDSATVLQNCVNCTSNNTCELNLINKVEHNLIQANSCPEKVNEFLLISTDTNEIQSITNIDDNNPEKLYELVYIEQTDNKNIYVLKSVPEIQSTQMNNSITKSQIIKIDDSSSTNVNFEKNNNLLESKLCSEQLDLYVLSPDGTIEGVNELQLHNYCLPNIKHNLEKQELKISPEKLNLVIPSSNETIEETNEMQLANYCLPNIKHNQKKQELKISPEKLNLVIPSSNETIEETNELQLDNYCLPNIKHNLEKQELKISPEKLNLVVTSSNKTIEETIELQLTQKQDDTTNYILLSSDKAIKGVNNLQLANNYCLENIKHNPEKEQLKISSEKLNLVIPSSNKTNEETNELQLANYCLPNIKHNLKKQELEISPEKLNLVIPLSNKTNKSTVTQKQDDTTNYLSNIKHDLTLNFEKLTNLYPEKLDVFILSLNGTIEAIKPLNSFQIISDKNAPQVKVIIPNESMTSYKTNEVLSPPPIPEAYAKIIDECLSTLDSDLPGSPTFQKEFFSLIETNDGASSCKPCFQDAFVSFIEKEEITYHNAYKTFMENKYTRIKNKTAKRQLDETSYEDAFLSYLGDKPRKKFKQLNPDKTIEDGGLKDIQENAPNTYKLNVDENVLNNIDLNTNNKTNETSKKRTYKNKRKPSILRKTNNI